MGWLRKWIDAVRARLPVIAVTREGETTTMQCPRCRTPLTLNLGEEGEHAYACPTCGERAVWTSPP